jgi:hypothetical protein
MGIQSREEKAVEVPIHKNIINIENITKEVWR